MDKESLSWRSFADKGGDSAHGPICKKWNLVGTPTLFVIDHHGVIRHKWLGSPGEKVIDAALDRLLKEAQGQR
jgi:hypothetical protein